MTYAEAILAAHQAVASAEAERARLISEALRHGASTRAIAAVIGVGHTTVWRWGGGATGTITGRAALDLPAS
jgi:hypothetical protein